MVKLEVTYNGLWELWRDADQRLQDIQVVPPDQRHISDKLAYPMLMRERSRLWGKITSHPLWKQSPNGS